jgi:hypothetical protein
VIAALASGDNSIRAALIAGGISMLAVFVSHFLTRRQLIVIREVTNSRLTHALDKIAGLEQTIRDLHGIQGEVTQKKIG